MNNNELMTTYQIDSWKQAEHTHYTTKEKIMNDEINVRLLLLFLRDEYSNIQMNQNKRIKTKKKNGTEKKNQLIVAGRSKKRRVQRDSFREIEIRLDFGFVFKSTNTKRIEDHNETGRNE